jgi:hypothetical protein
MSVPPKGEELHKKGEELPLARTRQEHARDFAQAIAEALKEELARGVRIKTIMGWTGAGERTVKGWLAGSSGPSGEHLEGLFRWSEAVYERVMVRAGRRPSVNRRSLEALRGQITGLADAIDAALADSPRSAAGAPPPA